jgi:hypothetical protein
MTLREDFAYIDSMGRRWLAPTGTVVDGASIPRLFWTVIGSPFAGKYRNASVVHDIECDEMRQPWQEVHRMFYEACRCGGVDEAQAKTMYYAVYHFGPRWQLIVENVIEQVVDADGQAAEQEVTIQHVVRIDPPPPTPDELERVKSYIVEDNPEPTALERFSRDSLQRRPWRGRSNQAPRIEPKGPAKPVVRETPSRNKPPEVVASSPRKTPDLRDGDLPNLRQSASGAQPRTPPLSQETQQWVTEVIRQHVEQQTGSPRPAEYQVERYRGGYRVLIQYLHEDEQGQMVPYEGGASTARISRDGKVLEMVSGFASPDVVDVNTSTLRPSKPSDSNGQGRGN